jgi:lambda family phage portal protein
MHWQEAQQLAQGPVKQPEPESNGIPVVSVDMLRTTAGAVQPPTPESGIWGGDKYYGGFGPTQIFEMDYYTLRERSGQLFRENLYARGLVRRLVTNEINTGLTLEATPDGPILGMTDDQVGAWSDNVESRFGIWSKNPKLCDYNQRDVFGKIQRQARREAIIDGDVLVILHQSKINGLPQIQLIKSKNVDNPSDQTTLRAGHTIDYGVERNAKGEHVAYWVLQEGKDAKRVPAYGARSGRRIAWLVYGSDKRLDEVRGEPLLSLVLQSLKEIDRYRDAALRKAVINSILAMFIEKGEPKMGTKPISGISTKKDSVDVEDDTNAVRQFKVAQQIPGMVIEELQHGEKPTPHSTAGTDVNFGPFSEAIIQAIAWANEIPPEILRLTFSSNYSASAAAINEFRMYLNMKRTGIGDTFCHPVYEEWLISEVLATRIIAAGFLAAWRDLRQYDIFGAWVASDWSGAIKPSTDIVKQAKGYEIQVDRGWITNARVARELNGSKFDNNIKQIKRENEKRAEAAAPLAAMEPTTNTDQQVENAEAINDAVVNLVDFVEEIENNG